MLLRQVALISETKHLKPAAVSRVSAALQKQVTRDFAPIWGISATVDAFDKLEDMSVGYWPVLIMDDIKTQGAAGVHEDKNSQPFALVQYDQDWALTASHECLEMLADPSGNRTTGSSSIKHGQGKVNYLVEVCDPSEGAGYGYTVNGITVSDFYTPHYFDPKKASGVRYSYTGAITEPRQVLRGGYLSWADPSTDEWWQCQYFSGSKKIVSLGVLKRAGRSLRSTIDAMTGLHLRDSAEPKKSRKDKGASLTGKVDTADTGPDAHHYTSATEELDADYAMQPASPLRAEIDRLRRKAP
jgi:hypothetical protein